MNNKNMKKLIATAALMCIATAIPETVNAASKTADIPVVAERLQTYEILRNVIGEDYVLLINKETGEYYDTDPNMENCAYWKNKKPGDVIQMKELLRKASYGQFNELEAVDGDACVGVYASRNQGDYY